MQYQRPSPQIFEESSLQLCDRVNHMSWADLTQDDVAAAATSLMIGLEENAFLLANTVTTEKIIIKPTNNICKYQGDKIKFVNSIRELSSYLLTIMIHDY